MTHSILLVDADSEHRTSIARSLVEAGTQVATEAASPDQALRIAAAQAPDVAIVTAALGNGGAIHLADRLSGEHGVPVVLLATVSGPATLALAAQSGVMGFLVEPVTPVALVPRWRWPCTGFGSFGRCGRKPRCCGRASRHER